MKGRTTLKRVRIVQFAVVVVLGALLAAPGCRKDGSGAAEPAPAALPRPAPIVLMGADGLEWDVLLPLLRAGRLPAMAALMNRGTYGLLHTMRPTLSPVIWTTIATGKMPAEHGILDFVKPWKAGATPELYTSRDRKTKAFWNILSDYDRRVAVVGWWVTAPVEPINGVMVAQTNTAEQFDATGQVHPPDRCEAIMAMFVQTEASMSELTEQIFGPFRYPLSPLGERLWGRCRWSFRADATYLRIAKQLLAEDEPYDLLAVYFGASDVVGHRFWRYMMPDRYKKPPAPKQIANFGEVIKDYYVYLDGVLGQLVALAGPNARVILLSDHGMKMFNTDGQYNQDDPLGKVNSGHHLAGEAGVIIAAGPGVARTASASEARRLERYDLQPLATVLDVTPTLLALLDIPVGEDFAGRVSQKLIDSQFLAAHLVKTVPTHDTEEWLQAHQTEAGPLAGQDERLEQLRRVRQVTRPHDR